MAGDFASRLKLTRPALVYLADKQGVIRSVTVANDLSGKLASLGQP
jgi:hypothetical protein